MGQLGKSAQKIVSAGPKAEMNKAMLLKLLFLCIFSFNYLSSIFLSPQNEISLLFYSIFVALFWFSYRAMKGYQYSYWGLNVLVGIFYLTSISAAQSILLYWFGLLIFGLENYIVSSPLFFPLVRWWEYDFRYRGDLRVTLHEQQKSSQARLTDIRRGAACLVSFESLLIGDEVTIESGNSKIDESLRATVASRKEPIAGRGFHYGILVRRVTEQDKESYERFRRVWLERKKRSLRHKFRKDPSSS